MTVPKEGEEDESGHNYYFDSIADMVRLQRQIANIKPGEASGLPSWTDGTCSRHELVSMKFDMWVALPENVTKALHTYSQLNYNHALHELTALEDLHNWRNHYPGLESIVMDDSGDCDIILLRTSFSLMNTFPPQSSKLGLVVELDFRHQNGENFKALSQFSAWRCVNSMFQAGYLFRKTEHKNCKVPEVGVVKPFFEADWWAGQFTRLTDKRRSAEEQGGETAVAAADDFSKNFLQTLTMMQEVFAVNPKREEGYESPPKRMAVLLWTFSQARQGHRGITTWQKLIAPPNRNSVTTPEPTDSMHISDGAMDIDPNDDFDTNMETVSFNQSMQMPSPSTYQPTSYHTGLTPLQDFNSDPAQHIDFSTFGSTGFTPSAANHYHLSNTGFATTSTLAGESSVVPSQDTVDDHAALRFNADDQRHGEDEHIHLDEQPTYNDQYDDNAAYLQGQDRHQPLAKFDMTTHMLLQAQLRDNNLNESFSTDIMDDTQHVATSFMVDNLDTMIDADDVLSNVNTPTITDSQVSFAGHMDHLGLHDEAMNQALISTSMTMNSVHNPLASQIDNTNMTAAVSTAMMTDVEEQHPVVFHSPRIQRPRLLAHHSFAGTLTKHPIYTDSNHHSLTLNNTSNSESLSNNPVTAATNDDLIFDTPVRNDFAKLMAHMQQQQEQQQEQQQQYDQNSHTHRMHMHTQTHTQTYLPHENNISLLAEQIYYANELGRPRSQPLPCHTEFARAADLHPNLDHRSNMKVAAGLVSDLMGDEHEHEHEQPEQEYEHNEFTIVEGYAEAGVETANRAEIELETEQTRRLNGDDDSGGREEIEEINLGNGDGNGNGNGNADVECMYT